MPERDGEGAGSSGPSERRRRVDLVDLIRLAVAAASLAVTTTLAAQGDPRRWEVRLFRLVNRLPGTVSAPLTGVMQLGALATVGIAALGAAIVERPRLARAILLSGGSSWGLAKLLIPLVGRRQPDDVLDQVFVRGHVLAKASFPSTHCAVAAAVAVAAAPYLGRLGRRLCALGTVAVAVSRLYVGAQFPLDALGGIALGATVAAAVALALGNEHTRLSIRTVERALAQRGMMLTNLAPWRADSGDTLLVGDLVADHSRRLVRVASRHERANGWLSRLWRIVAYRDVRELGPLRSPRDRNEHGALMSVLAERAHVATPPVCALYDVGAEYSLAVHALPDGCRLTEVAPEVVDIPLLVAVWRQVAALHGAGVKVGPLAGDDIIVDERGEPWLVDLGGASLAIGPLDRGRDNAEVLVGLALVSNPAMACEAAAAVLGLDELAASTQYLHPLELAVSTRRRLRGRSDLLARCRAAAALVTGVEVVGARPAARVAARNLTALVVGAVALNVLLTQVGHAARTFSALHRPHWAWVAVLLGAMLVTYLGATIAMMGATPMRLPFARTFGVQFAAAFTNRLAPAGIGGMVTNLRYLEREGSSRASAVAAITVNALAGVIVHVIAFVAVLPFVGSLPSIDVDPPRSWPLLLGALALLSTLGVVMWIKLMPAHIGHRVREAFQTLVAVLQSPARGLALFGGSLVVTAAYAVALFAALHAFGSGVSLPSVAAVYLGASAIAAVSPTPGGLGALEVGLVAGLSRVGVPASVAVAGVLGYRLVTYWLPIVPGLVAIRVLRLTAASAPRPQPLLPDHGHADAPH